MSTFTAGLAGVLTGVDVVGLVAGVAVADLVGGADGVVFVGTLPVLGLLVALLVAGVVL